MYKYLFTIFCYRLILFLAFMKDPSLIANLAVRIWYFLTRTVKKKRTTFFIIPYCSWGGCIVAIICKNEVQRFVDALRADLSQNTAKSIVELKDMVFPTAPNQGAVIYTTLTPL